MKQYVYMAPCHFGIEAVLKREIINLGYEIIQVEDGKITFTGNQSAIARANIFLRTAERIMVRAGKFEANTFDELFESTKAIPWENYLPKDAKFWVTKATAVKSTLMSTTDIQSIVKKAIVERLKSVYGVDWLSETGAKYPLRVNLIKNEVTIGIDTTGVSLHKRGYRLATAKAPLSETLAAALIMLTPWKKDRILIDPFCGSGTIAIEAALIGANIAPGINRSFIAEQWTNIISARDWYNAIDEAYKGVNKDVTMHIQAFDLDADMIKAARENAERADVAEFIHFQQRDFHELKSSKKFGFIITNPPYGERLEEKSDMPKLYSDIGKIFAQLDSWSYFIISGYDEAAKYIGKKPTKNRKIYNGMLKTYYYQYMGPKPPRRD